MKRTWLPRQVHSGLNVRECRRKGSERLAIWQTMTVRLTPGARPDLDSCIRTLMVSNGWQHSYTHDGGRIRGRRDGTTAMVSEDIVNAKERHAPPPSPLQGLQRSAGSRIRRVSSRRHGTWWCWYDGRSVGYPVLV